MYLLQVESILVAAPFFNASAFLTCCFIPSPGILTPEPLRENIKRAMRDKDKENLQKVVDECEAAGLRELDSDISLAKDVLATLTGRAGSSRTLLVSYLVA